MEMQREALAESAQFVPQTLPSLSPPAIGSTVNAPTSFPEPPRAVYQVPEALPLEYVQGLLETLDKMSVESYEQGNITIRFDVATRQAKRAEKALTEQKPW